MSRSNWPAQWEGRVTIGAPSILVLVLLLSGGNAGADEWTRFRGPNGAGISDAATVPVQWTDADYNWKIVLPGIGHSSPVVWGKRIFLTRGDPDTAGRIIICLETTDGCVVWRRDYTSQTYRQHRSNSYASATPAVDADGLIVTWSTPDDVLLVALDLDGRDQWRRSLGPYVCKHGTGTSPIFVDDLVVLAARSTVRPSV